MKKIFYEKVKGRYKPTKEYDSELMDSLPKGAHLIICRPGIKSVKRNIDPNYAALIAASVVAEDKICNAMIKAQELQPQFEPLTPEQLTLWKELAASFNRQDYPLVRASVAEVTKKGVDALIEEANRLMKYEAVRQAYEHFIAVAKLCADTPEDT